MQTQLNAKKKFAAGTISRHGNAVARTALPRETDLAALAIIGTVISIPRGGQIYREGDRADSWFKLVDGAACTNTLLADGRRQIASFLLPGQVFGFEAPNQHRFSAEALSRTTLLRYPRIALERLAEGDPQINRQLRELAYDRLCTAHGRILLLGRKTAPERLATFLTEMLEYATADDVVELPMSRGDIGDYLGLNLETVSRTFSLFKHMGLIALSSPVSVTVLNRDALDDIAMGDTSLFIFPCARNSEQGV